jgi:hypothetical protein
MKLIIAASQGKPKGNKTKKTRKIDCTCRNCLPNLPHLPQLTDSQPHKASRKATKTNKQNQKPQNRLHLPNLPAAIDWLAAAQGKRKGSKKSKIDCTCGNCLPNLPQLTDSQLHKESRTATKNKQTKHKTAKSIAPTEPAAIACQTCRTCRNWLTRSRTRKAERQQKTNKQNTKPQNRLHLPSLPQLPAKPAAPAAIDWPAAAQGKTPQNRLHMPNLPQLPAEPAASAAHCCIFVLTWRMPQYDIETLLQLLHFPQTEIPHRPRQIHCTVASGKRPQNTERNKNGWKWWTDSSQRYQVMNRNQCNVAYIKHDASVQSQAREQRTHEQNWEQRTASTGTRIVLQRNASAW